MLVQILLTLLVLALLSIINACWIRPKKLMKFYETQFKNTKYRIKFQPYKLFYNGYFEPQLAGKKQGDPLKIYKQQYPSYDVVISNLMNTPFIEICHLDFIKDFYSMDKHYDYPKLKAIISPLKMLFGPGVGFSEGNIWKRKRILLNRIFNFDFLKIQTPNIVQVCDRCIKQLEQKCQVKEEQGQNGKIKYIQCHIMNDLLIKIFSSVIMTSFLDLRDRYQIEGVQVCEYLLSIIDDIGQYRLQSPTIVFGEKFFNLGIRKIDQSINQRSRKLKEWGKIFLKQKLQRYQKQIDQQGDKLVMDNVIKTFLVYKKQNKLPDDDPVISEQNIFAEFIGFIFAGTDTTSNLLNMLICYLGKYPQTQQKLRQEVDEFMKNDDYSYENLKNFKYIDALQKQTTRIYGPINIISIRQVAQDNYINGVPIKKGTLLSMNPYGNHYSQQYFKNPLQFRPERWLNGECDNQDPFVVIGFSAGARTCSGKHLALLQSKIALIKIMKRYKSISIPNKNFKMDLKLFTCPEEFKVKLQLKE